MLKKIRDLFGRRNSKNIATGSTSPAIHRGPQVIHRPIPRSDLDHDAVKIVERLTRFEHSAYLVGGCVRDLLLDRHPKDFDIATSATPRQMKRVFRNCRIIGRRFRLAHIYFQDGKIIEVATFRSGNGEFGNGEPAGGASANGPVEDVETDDTAGPGDPDDVEATDLMIRDDNVFGTPEEDALRRDFTINSLFYDLNNETVLDHAGGIDDLRRRLVRTIGPPAIRFSEDPIRILRAIKFAARLGFEIERETLAALRDRADEIPKAAAPRILEEINRFAREGRARQCFELLRRYGVFAVILPELTDTYTDAAAWELLCALLDSIDSRQAAGREVSTGEILAALLLPAVATRIGWRPNGTAELPKGIDLRKVIDGALRPLALRLRVSRREQERCRQIIAILARMVPVERVRKNMRRALLRRVNFLDALWMLEVLASQHGNQFATAFEEWETGSEEAGAHRDAWEEDARRGRRGAATEEAADGRRRRKRGGRRRGGRGRGRAAGTTASGESAVRTGGTAAGGKTAARSGGAAAGSRTTGRAGARKAPVQREKWDDDYFFSALPSAPSAGTDDGGDRYGAGDVTSDDDQVNRADEERSGAQDATGREEVGSPPRRKRRRRRRRRGERREGDGDAAPTAPAAPADGDDNS